jgi:hypothetical protein
VDAVLQGPGRNFLLPAILTQFENGYQYILYDQSIGLMGQGKPVLLGIIIIGVRIAE